MTDTPDFDAIKQLNIYGVEYWSARELMGLLGYKRWENFEVALERARQACVGVGETVEDHFRDATKVIKAGKGASHEVKDYLLSRLACYLVAQNGDPRKAEIAAAQLYFAVSTRENELRSLKQAQEERLLLRQQVAESNRDLAKAAQNAGVQNQNFGRFQNAGYAGMYGGLNIEAIKLHKGIPDKEDLLDRAGRAELAANFFRITQTEQKLRVEQVQGEETAIDTHHQVGKQVRQAIREISGQMPEDLPTEPTIRPLIEERKRRKKKSAPAQSPNSSQPGFFDEPT